MNRIEILKVIHADLLRDAEIAFSIKEMTLGRSLMQMAGFVRNRIAVEETQEVLSEAIAIRMGLK